MLAVRDSQMKQMARANPGTQMTLPCGNTATWIDVRLLYPDGRPVAGAKYRVELPDSSIQEGTLDDEGKVRFDGIVPGQAVIEFPGLDGREWKPR